jgi:signal transduction histidine kinase
MARRMAPSHLLKNLRVRARLLLLVIIPTATAIAAGGGFVASSVQSALVYQRVLTLANLSGKITGLAQALQSERVDTVRFIVLGNRNGGRGASPSSTPSPEPELRLLSQDYSITTGWANQVTALASGIDGSYSAPTQQDMQAAVTAIGNLPAIRAAATGTQVPALLVIGQYATAINTLLAVESQIAVGTSDSALAGSVRVLGLISGMKEEASEQQAYLTSALRSDLVSLGQFGPAQQSGITDAQAQQQGDLTEFGTAATASQRQLFNNVLSSPNVVQAQAQEQQAISLASSGSPIASDPTVSDATAALSYVVSGLRSVEESFADSVIAQSGTLRNDAITSAVIFGLAVALLLAIALTATIIVGRSMVGPLRRLRNEALEIAGDRLPEAVRRIGETASGSVPLDVEPIDVDSSDEIGEVARAFDQVHREAVRLASNEAALRGNVSAMFINLSRRSVPLIGRLGQMIDFLEQTEDDPERLSSLFSMDHLITRMRRNSENLLVLAGEEPVRKWSEPVLLVDVVRAAISEIEQYSRVALNIQQGVVVSGQTAADIVHLLAEVIENATMFSPRDTWVHILAQEAPAGGVLIEVRDSGVGISPLRLSEINERLDNPPLVDVSVSQHMGLFAVARLASRHGVRVRLQAATPRGLSALVWLPESLIGREPVPYVGQRSRYLAEDASFVQLRVGGRRGRHAAPEQYRADGGQWGDAGRPAAAAGQKSNWFRAKRPSGRGRPGASLTTTALGGAGPIPAVAQDVAPDTGSFVSAFGASPQSMAARPAAAPDLPVQGADFTPPWGTPDMPVQGVPDDRTAWDAPGLSARRDPGPGGQPDDGWRIAETARPQEPGGRTAAGLPVRTPGENLIRGSVGDKAASGPAVYEAQALGRRPGISEADQGVPRRTAPQQRSPEHARNRLGGFQLGSREAEAEAETPSAGEGASR